MNKTYRLIRNNPDFRSKPAATLVAASLFMLTPFAHAAGVAADTLPTGAQVVSGTAGIATSGNLMTIAQTSNKAIVNFNTFSIGASAEVNVTTPSSSAVTLARVTGSDPSAIYGTLKSTGQFFLVNPSGVLFAPGAHVDVGGLVATTMNISNSDFNNGNYRFTRDGSSASVVNQGEILGKYVALLAPEVRNEGNIIVARQGTAALAAGEAVRLNITGNDLIDVQVDKASINTLVENKSLVQADDGLVVMSAQSANQLLGQVVNSGLVEANGLNSDGGVIRLRASSNIANNGSLQANAGVNGNGGTITVIADLSNQDSVTTVDGTLSAKGGSQSGNGGFIETSAQRLSIADSARINTTATNGKMGQWLLDPNDFIVAATGGDITGAALGNALDLSNVTIQTTGTTASCTNAACTTGSAGNGDILINDSVSWSTNNNLTLDAWRDIIFNASLTTSGGFGLPSFANVQINYGASGTGKAVIASGVSWDITAPNIVDNEHASTVTAGGAADTTHDYYIGTKNIPIYVELIAGTGNYGDTSLPTQYLTAPGGTIINIATPSGSANWDIDPATFTVSGGPYSLSYISGLSSPSYSSLVAGNAASWTVIPLAITVTADNRSKTYGSALGLGSTAFSLTSGSLAFSDTISSATLGSANGYAANTSQGVGTYSGEVTIGAATGTGGFNASNYTITYQSGDLTINPATLTYNANAASIQAGDAIPALSGTVTGFVNGETQAGVTSGMLAFNTTATTSSPAGSYVIDGSGLTAANYVFAQAVANSTALTIATKTAQASQAVTTGGTLLAGQDKGTKPWLSDIETLYLAMFGKPIDAKTETDFSAALKAANVPNDALGLKKAYKTNAAVKLLVDSLNTAEGSLTHTLSTKELVNQMYVSITGTAVDLGGVMFWSVAIDSGNVTPALVALAMMVEEYTK